METNLIADIKRMSKDTVAKLDLETLQKLCENLMEDGLTRYAGIEAPPDNASEQQAWKRRAIKWNAVLEQGGD